MSQENEGSSFAFAMLLCACIAVAWASHQEAAEDPAEATDCREWLWPKERAADGRWHGFERWRECDE